MNDIANDKSGKATTFQAGSFNGLLRFFNVKLSGFNTLLNAFVDAKIRTKRRLKYAIN